MGILGRGFLSKCWDKSVISNCVGLEGFVQIMCKRLFVLSLKIFNHTDVSVSTTQGSKIRELPKHFTAEECHYL